MRPRSTVSGVLAGLMAVMAIQASAVHAQHDAPRKDSSWPTSVGALGCPAPVWKPGDGARIVVIGDSLTREGRVPLTRALREQGWNPTIRCWGGTRLDWAIDQVKQAKLRDQLPTYVVVAIGTNDMRWIDRQRTRARMRALVEAIGPKRNILWVDTFASGGDRFTKAKQRWFNAEVRALASHTPQLRVASWGAFAQQNNVQFADALHYNERGERTWAQFVADEVAQAFGG